MPITAITTLPDEDQPVLDASTEDEITVDRETQVTNNGDVRIQIREVGATAWDGTAEGFAEQVIAFDTLTTTFTGLEDGEAYEVKARTETDDVTGNYTTAVSATTALPAPGNLTLTPTATDTIDATWTDNADNEDGFKVFLAEETDQFQDTGFETASQVADLAPDTTSYTITGLKENFTYEVFIQAYTEDTTSDSSTVQETTNIDVSGPLTLIVGSVRDNRRKYTQDDFVSVSPALTHTGLNDMRATLKGDRNLEAFAARQGRISWYADGSVKWSGYLTNVSHSLGRGTTTIQGEGVAKRLKETRPDYDSIGGPVNYSNILLSDALRDYWARTPFGNYTVYDQTTQLVADDDLIQSADTNTEWGNVTPTFADDVPIGVQNGNLELLQACHFEEAEDGNFVGNPVTNAGNYSDDEAIELVQQNDFVEFSFTNDYRYPEADLFFATFAELDSFDGEVTTSIDGTTIQTDTFNGLTQSLDTQFAEAGSDLGSDLNAGTHTYRVEITSYTSGSVTVDGLYVGDRGDRFTPDFGIDISGYTFDSNTASWNGPPLYPQEYTVELDVKDVTYNIVELAFTGTWNDTSNNQAIGLSIDGGSNYTTSSNTQNATVDFSGSAGSRARIQLTFSRFVANSTFTPTVGDSGQTVDSFELRADGNNAAVIDDLDLSKNHFENLQTLHDKGNYLWVIEPSDDEIANIPVESFRRGDQTETLPDEPEIDSSPEVAAKNYYNTIFLQGALVSGSRPSFEVQDSQRVQDDGRVISPGVLRDLDITTQDGVEFRAQQLLDRATINDALRGQKVFPARFDILPGYSYETSFGPEQSEEFTLEEVKLRLGTRQAEVTLDFVPPQDLSEDISELRQNARQQSDRL